MVNKDWKGDSNSVYKTLGASNHTEEERETNDWYATDPIAGELLLKLETINQNIWEPACGSGELAKVFEAAGYKVISSDLIDRGFGRSGVDFLKCNKTFDGDIITNPPYSLAQEFIEKAIEVVNDGNKVIMFLKVQFLEGKSRKKLFEKYPPKTVWISSSRILCAKNADFEKGRKQGSAVAYAWYVWEKGYTGDTVVKWFN